MVCQCAKSATAAKKKKSKAKRKTGKTTTDDNEHDQRALTIITNNHKLFQSPPVPGQREAENLWEWATRDTKATAYRTELRQRLQQACKSQLGNYRQAVTAAETLTSTDKNRRHFSHAGSQELGQTLVRLFGAKYKLAEYCHSLEKVRRNAGKMWGRLLAWTAEFQQQQLLEANELNGNDFVQRVLFPFGMDHPRRVDPRTPEMKLVQQEQAAATTASGGVPYEIVVDRQSNRKTSSTNNNAKNKRKQEPKVAAGKKGSKIASAADDNESGIVLDDLKCCNCHQGTASDDNDLILCDGNGCYRAYHMKCCKPEITAQDLKNEDDDWFCPICSGLADLLLLIQSEYMGDEWEQRRYALQLDDKETTGSVKSWDAVDDVFPEAEWEYETACQLKEGRRNKATNELLAQVLGLDSIEGEEEDDNVEEDEHFDLGVFETERRKGRKTELEGEATDDDETSNSSQASLVNMDCVELEIGKDELAALSEQEDGDDSEEESDDNSEGPRRRSRRIQKHESANHIGDMDPGKMDESNILKGKRGRKSVDYIKLNEAIFGGLPDAEAAKIDDADDFQVKAHKKGSEGSDDSSGEDGSDSSVGDDSDNNDGNDGSRSSESDREKESPRKKSKQVSSKDDSKVLTNKQAVKRKAAANERTRKRKKGANGKQ